MAEDVTPVADADEDAGPLRIALEEGLSHTSTWQIL